MHRHSIYTVGGTVQASGGAYLVRAVDDSLLDLCAKGEFGFVLTARQMGKSSVMVRTAEQLKRRGVRSVMIDLSEIGVQLSDDAWYLGLLTAVEDQLDLQTDLFEWWNAHDQLGFGQRLTKFFETVVLKEISEPVVIFVDEIDSTLSLSFTDDFFAAIRYVFNARTHVPEFRRLSFVLIGVATPNDLISDPVRTPFNIGRQVDVDYFSEREAVPLAEGFHLPPEQAREVLRWVMQWTSGHPYLTQRLCSLVAVQATERLTRDDVDRIVAAAFFGERSEQDSNLRFVHDMLTRRSHDPNEALATYQKILQGRSVPDDRQSRTVTHLKLSGIVQRRNGRLEVSNEIYRSVFDQKWIKRQWPEHWLKRVPPAVRGLVAASFVAVILFSLVVIQFQANRQAAQEAALSSQLAESATRRAAEADSARIVQQGQAIVADSLRSVAQVAKADADYALAETRSQRDQVLLYSQALERERDTADSLRRVTVDANLTLMRDGVVKDSLSDVALALLRETRLARLETMTLALANASQRQVRLGNKVLGAMLARQAYLFSLQGEGAYTDAIYDALIYALNGLSESGAAGGPLTVGVVANPVRAVAMNLDATWLAVGQEVGEILFVRNPGQPVEERATVQAHRGAVRSIGFSAARNAFISGGEDGVVRVWRLDGLDEPEVLGRHGGAVWTLAVSPDGVHVASAGADGRVRFWDIDHPGQPIRSRTAGARIRSVAYSPDGSTLAAGDEGGTLHLWRQHGIDSLSWASEQGRVHAVAFSAKGHSLLTGGDSTTVRQWLLPSDDADPRPEHIFFGHEGPVNSLAVNRAGSYLSSGSADHSIQVWSIDREATPYVILQRHSSWIWSHATDETGSFILSGSDDGTALLWNLDLDLLATRVCSLSTDAELSPSDWDTFVGPDFDYASEYTRCSLPGGVAHQPNGIR